LRLLGFLLVVIGALLMAALTAPYWLDTSRYKEEIVAGLSAALARPVTIEGAARVEFLPAPTLSAEQVRVAAPPGGRTGNLLTAQRLDLRLDWAALLQGRLQVSRVALVEPVLTLERLADGSPNWRAQTQSGGSARLADAVRFDNVVIDRGRLAWLPRGDSRPVQLERIRGLLKVEPSGPFSFRGEVYWQAHALQVEATAGRPAAGATALPATLVANFGPGLAQARLVGNLEDGIDPRWRGQASLEIGEIGKILPGWTGPLSLIGQLDATSAQIELNELRLVMAEGTATGVAQITTGNAPRVDLALKMAQLDLDKLSGQARALPPFAALLPAAPWRATLDLQIAAALLNGGVVRQLALNGEAGPEGLTLKQLSAYLPGGSELGLSGQLAAPEGKPRFDGAIELTTDNARALCGWLGWQVSAVPGDRLRAAWLKAKLAVADEVAQLADLSFGVDVTNGSGAAAFALRARPSFSIDLLLDRLNLDGYWPRDGWLPDAAWLQSFDSNLRVSIERMDLRETPATDVELDLSLVAGAATIRQASVGEYAGASFALTGKVESRDKKLGYDLSLQGSGPDYQRILRTLGLDRGPLDRQIFGPFALSGGGAGDAESMPVLLERIARDTKVEPR
jgi:hypothetical protein